MKRQIVERREIPLPSLPQGSQSSFGVVDLVYDDGSVRRLWQKDDGVQIFALTVDGRVIAVIERGYTHLPGGYVEPGESPEAAARRELREETGYNALDFQLLASVLQDSGGSARRVWLYMARKCSKAGDGEEGISVTLMDPRRFWHLLTTYVMGEPGTKRMGLMSLAVTTLAFQRLGWIAVSSERGKGKDE